MDIGIFLGITLLLIIVARLIVKLRVGHGAWDEVDENYDEFDDEGFEAYDRASDELWDKETRLNKFRIFLVIVLFVLLIAACVVFALT